MAKYHGTGSFSFRTVYENSVPLEAHYDGCRKCKHWRGTIQLNVHVREWSLPKLTFATQISVSGLSPPSWSAEWRERDATILNYARCSRFPMFKSRALSVSQDLNRDQRLQRLGKDSPLNCLRFDVSGSDNCMNNALNYQFFSYKRKYSPGSSLTRYLNYVHSYKPSQRSSDLQRPAENRDLPVRTERQGLIIGYVPDFSLYLRP